MIDGNASKTSGACRAQGSTVTSEAADLSAPQAASLRPRHLLSDQRSASWTLGTKSGEGRDFAIEVKNRG
jgi:hypothetical protein